MKLRMIVASTFVAFATAAHAQSSVTLYGIVDASVEWLNHADQSGNSVIKMNSGGLSESRWGILGKEDLGGGNLAVFNLENRFFSNGGQLDPALPFWNVAYIGLSSPRYGTLTFGRQYGVVVDVTTRTYGTNQWVPYSIAFQPNFSFQPQANMVGGVWSSNMAKYSVHYGDFVGEASYAFGGVPGAPSYGSQVAAGIAYVPTSSVRLSAAYSDSRDSINGTQFKVWTAGGAYILGKTQFRLGYYVNLQDHGFSTYLNGPFTAPVLAALKYTDFSARRMVTAGITQELSPAFRVSFNYWRTFQTGKTLPQDGTASQFEILCDYSLSKRTDVYVESNYSLYRGGLIGAQLQGLNAASVAQKGTQLGAMVGMRHAF